MIGLTMRGPRISIIVPVYNAAPYLVQCLDSLIHQTLQDIEIILVDDGSTDNSLAICKQYAQKDARITVIHQSNQGQTIARRRGLAEATGQYIHFVDSDDWLDLAMEQEMYDSAVRHEADIVTCHAVFHKNGKKILARQSVKAGVYDKERLVSELYPQLICTDTFLYFGIFAAMWNKLYRRELIEKYIADVDPAVRIGEDGLTTFACFLAADKVVALDASYYQYRDDNTTSITRSYCWEQFDSALLLIVYLRRIAEEYKDVYDINPQIDWYLLYNIRSIMLEEFFYRHKKTYRNRYVYLKRIISHPAVIEVCARVDFSQGFTDEQRRFFALIRSESFRRAVANAAYKALDMRLRHITRRHLAAPKQVSLKRLFMASKKSAAQTAVDAPSHLEKLNA